MSKPTPSPSAADQNDASPGGKAPYRYTARLADKIETRWQAFWEEHDTFRTPNPGEGGFDGGRPKFYCLDMFPYPSGAGLHVGHPEGYTATDIVCRYKRHQGFNVLHPMGWDAFGLPAEQYAIQTGVHPAITTTKAIETFRKQLKRFGFDYDWSRQFATIDETFYKWTQWIWLQAYKAWFDPAQRRARPIDELAAKLESGEIRIGEDLELVFEATEGDGSRAYRELSTQQQRDVIDAHRLAYLAVQTVNWCPKLGTALANEEVKDGLSERGHHPVYRKPLRQWMYRITAFADRLAEDLDLIEWPESTAIMEREWIGRSEGAEVDFPLVARRSASCAEPPGSRTPTPHRGLEIIRTAEELDLTDQYLLTVPEYVARDPFPTGEATPENARQHRRDLPHIELRDATYFVTWRCADDVVLSEEERQIVLDALRHWDGSRADVIAACVMPDHVHWLIKPYADWPLAGLCESVKHYSATEVNRHRGRHGSIWLGEAFDHVVRDAHRLSKYIFYILLNPVRGGLVERVSEYSWSFVRTSLETPGGEDVMEFVEATYRGMLREGTHDAERHDTGGHDAERRATEYLRVYTTRPDTLFGATFMVVAPEHPLIEQLLASPLPNTGVEALRAYVEAARHRADIDRMAETKEKTGVFTGAYAINPVNGEQIPIWTADYVLMGYGHGAIMAVPAHDDRDFAFATKFNIPIIQVIEPEGDEVYDGTGAFTGDGRNINSANDEISINDLPTPEAIRKITNWLEKKRLGRFKVNYRLRDWLFSRQRYWGEPFPIVYDEQGNHYPVDESSLPVILPQMEDYQPIESDEPLPMLAKAKNWVNTTAGEAGVSPDVLPPDTPVRRETNTMPTWAGSCWYYLRYCDPKNNDRFIGRDADRYWMLSPKKPGTDPKWKEGYDPARHQAGGIDLYLGGSEYANTHLLYTRFWHKLLYDLGEVTTPEPFHRLFHQGLITSFAYQRPDRSLAPMDAVEETAEGEFIEKATGKAVKQVIAKMSKSLKNVINPDDVIAEFGADTFRLYEMYMGPLEATKPWNTRDIIGVFRFLQRIWRLVVSEDTGELTLRGESDEHLERLLHRTIAKVGGDIERLALNTAIAAMIEFINEAYKAGGLSADQLARFAVVLSPFAPHIAEELWSRLGHDESLACEPWPEHDEAMIRREQIELPVQILGKVRGRITVSADADQKTIEEAALNDERIRVLLEGKTVRKVIVVAGKIVNIVAH